MPWYKLLKDVEFILQDEHLESFDNIKKDSLIATEYLTFSKARTTV